MTLMQGIMRVTSSFFVKNVLGKVALYGLFFMLYGNAVLAQTVSDKKAQKMLQRSFEQDTSFGDVSVVADPLIRDVVIWTRLQKNMDVPYGDVFGLMKRRGHWPGLGAVQIRLEKRMVDDPLPLRDVLAFFEARPPVSPTGKLLYAEALYKAKKRQRLSTVVKDYWVTSRFAEGQEKQFFSLARPWLTQHHHEQRLQHLIIARDVESAWRMLPKVSKPWRVRGKTCIALLDPKATPPRYRSLVHGGRMEELVAWSYMRYLARTRQFRKVPDVFAYLPKHLEDPELFHSLRMMSARELLEMGRYREAVRLLNNHQIAPTKILMYSDIQWHLGWVWFSFLDNTQKARPYFERFLKIVKTPISLSRGHYWMGRLYETEKKKDKSTWHYRKASRHKAAFYGQLASYKLGITPIPTLKGLPAVPTAARRKLNQQSCAKAARLLSTLGPDGLIGTKMFLQTLVPSMKTPMEKKALLRLAHDIHPSVVVDISRAFWIKGDPFVPMRCSYPLCKLPNLSREDKAVALAIIYKETRFDPYVTGDAGEKGLMQVMPNTAVMEAKALNVHHHPDKLSEPAHNILLGMAHFKRHQKQFNFHPLTISAYNAGAKAVLGWEKRIFSKKRTVFHKHFPRFIDYYVNLTESVPYESTRGYVQRFLETYAIYRSRLNLPFVLKS
ncbi:lytic transglycosylase domain-containing protein [bacterium NHP-B]|nr:lytic transglycosylase domain-containing protein [bacterium NHP-B]